MPAILTLAATVLSLPSATTALAAGPEPERPWTLMVYGAADNNADGPILEFLDGVRTALDDDPGMELILFIDRSEGFSTDARSLGDDFTGARIYRLRKDSAELLDAGEYFPGMGSDGEYEVDSADPAHVGSFVRFCKERFPARNYGLMIYSHADGCTMCPDEESGRDMHIPELTDVVGEDESVDFLALELCNMGGIEIAYQWRPWNGGFSADVLVAIPNAGPPLDWDRAFARIRSEGHAPAGEGKVLDPAKMTAAEFGTLVVEEGHRGRLAMAKRFPHEAGRLKYEAAACYDLNRAEDVKEAVDAFAVALAGNAGTKEVLEGLRDEAMDYVRGQLVGERPYVDLFDLATRAAKSEELPDAVRVRAKEVAAAVDELVLGSFGMEGLGDFRPGAHGVFIVFPDGDAQLTGLLGNERAWSRMGWYTPLEAWDEGQPYGRWAFLMDGATPGDGQVDNWFELLDAWFDDTSSGPEGLNRYAP